MPRTFAVGKGTTNERNIQMKTRKLYIVHHNIVHKLMSFLLLFVTQASKLERCHSV